MSMRSVRLGLAIAFAVVATQANARTWHVERDGSAEFTTIQPAVNAAAPGDSIAIGPGRYTEWHVAEGFPQWMAYVQTDKDLTFIGAGIGQTIIGPEDVFEFNLNDRICGFFSIANNIRLTVNDLTVANVMLYGIYLENGRLELHRCEILGCVEKGIYAICPSGGWVRDCSFHDNGLWGQQAGTALEFYEPSIGVEVDNCNFVHNYGDGIASFWAGCRDIDISDCTIDQGNNGVVFADGASGAVRNCTISNQSIQGILLAQAGHLILEDNFVTAFDQTHARHYGVTVWTDIQSLTMRNNVVISNYCVLLFTAEVLDGDVSQNHFLRETDTTWWVRTSTYWPLPNPRIIKLENNYWGTTDTALLGQWIYDGNDNPDVDIFMDYLPLADGPVQTESTTWGAVKALFE
jgi:hypothetical protein